jgi:hypothetical protein
VLVTAVLTNMGSLKANGSVSVFGNIEKLVCFYVVDVTVPVKYYEYVR